MTASYHRALDAERIVSLGLSIYRSSQPSLSSSGGGGVLAAKCGSSGRYCEVRWLFLVLITCTGNRSAGFHCSINVTAINSG